MSLLVWLPLNGNLENKGLNLNITLTNTGATVATEGKIGSCYKFTPTSKIAISNNAMTAFTTEASACFWLKINTWNTAWGTYFQAGLGTSPWNSYIMGFLRNNTTSTCCFTISDGSTSSLNYWVTPTLTLGLWYHIGLIYKTGYALLYVNGILRSNNTTSIVPNFAGITAITLGCINNNQYPTDCQINDFRIYNHALSPEEVAQIAQGLVVHYPLTERGFEMTKNLVWPIRSNNYTTPQRAWDSTKHTGAINVTGWADGYNGGVPDPSHGYHAHWKLIDEIPTIVFIDKNSTINQLHRWLGVSSTSFVNNLNELIPAGTKYTISFDMKVDNNILDYCTTGLYYKLKSSDANASFHDGCYGVYVTQTNQWQRVSRTYIRSSNYDGNNKAWAIYIYGLYGATESTKYVRNIQIEVGDYATPYVETLRGSLFDHTIYQESDGSLWVRMFHHNNPAGGLFASSDTFTTGIYKDANRWFDVYGVVNQLSRYEFMVKLKTTSDATEMKYRWVLNISPLTAQWEEVTRAKITPVTGSGYNNVIGGLCKYTSTSNTHMVINDGGRSDWFGATGCWNLYQGGMPGYPSTTITSGYMDIYARVDDLEFVKIYDISGYNNHSLVIGNLLSSTDSVRYDRSIKKSNGSYIKSLYRPNDCLPHDQITVNIWVKYSTWNNPVSCTESGGFNFEANSSHNYYIEFPVYVSGKGYAEAVSSSNRNSLKNNWHMLTGVFDGTNIIIYIDGVESGRNSTQQTGTIGYANNWLFLGAEALGNVVTPINSPYEGNLSDFRVYATALSAAAVKDLYNMGVK